VSLVELDQLQKILAVASGAGPRRKRPLFGLLVGRDFSPQLMAMASKPGSNVSLFSFLACQLTFKLIPAGPPRLIAIGG
jgi:hypothetical protein